MEQGEISLSDREFSRIKNRVYQVAGISLSDAKRTLVISIVVVKSSQHFYASFSKIASRVIYAAAPGAVTLDLRTLPYRKVRRPKWPLDG